MSLIRCVLWGTASCASQIDAVYLPAGAQPWPVARGRVFQAPSLLPTAAGSSATTPGWAAVLAVDVTEPFELLPSYLYPSLAAPMPSTTGTFVALPWVRGGAAAIAAACANGLPAAGCVATFDALNPLDLYVRGSVGWGQSCG